MNNTYLMGEKTYRLHYSIGRLEMIEKAAGVSAMTMFAKAGNQELPPISLLNMYFAYGLLEDGGVYAPLKAALEFAAQQMEENGYNSIMNAVLEQLQEDCGFLFR